MKANDLLHKWATGALLRDKAATQAQARLLSLVASGAAREEHYEAAGEEWSRLAKESAPRTKYTLGSGTGVDLTRKEVSDSVSRFPWILSTEQVDADGDIVRQDWDLSRFNKNPVLLRGHQMREFPIGKVEDLVVEGIGDERKLVGNVVIIRGVTEDADKAANLVDAGLLNAGSVGFIPKRVDFVDDEEERQRLGLSPRGAVLHEPYLLEFSLVSVPSNADAVRRAVETGEVTSEDVEYAMKAYGASATERELSKIARARYIRHFPELFIDELGAEVPDEKAQEGLELMTQAALADIVKANTASNKMLAEALTDFANRVARSASSEVVIPEPVSIQVGPQNKGEEDALATLRQALADLGRN